MSIEKLKNNFPDSVAGETSAGPMEIAEKVNEIIDVLNVILEALKNETKS